MDQSTVSNDCTAATKALLLGPAAEPIAAGTCCRKMITAMPRVKPSITGQGMKVTARPSLSAPAAITTRPAIRLSTATTPTPWAATTGPSTTTMAPVGPETWMLEPPNTAAMTPATMAVIRPLSAPAPELTPKARASGSAMMPTVSPATMSPRQVRLTSR